MFLGIDVGSTAIKLGIVNTAGKLISYFQSPYSTQTISEEHVEQDPNDWFKLIVKGLNEFKNENPNCDLNALSMCSQVNTHIFVDENGEALLPAIFWQEKPLVKKQLYIWNLNDLKNLVKKYVCL